MPGRNYSSSSYRYGFNGQESDPELFGSGNSASYEYRIEDTRLGRFLSIDPLSDKFPFYSPYQFCSNSPIMAVELEGLETSNNQNASEQSFVEQNNWQMSNDGSVLGTIGDYSKAVGNAITNIGWASLDLFVAAKEGFPEFMRDPERVISGAWDNFTDKDIPHFVARAKDFKNDPGGESLATFNYVLSPQGVQNLTTVGIGVFLARPASATGQIPRLNLLEGVNPDLIRVRHHTSADGLKGIKTSQSINASRSKPFGVDVEVSPFVKPSQANMGQAGKGAYVEFSVKKSNLSPIPGGYMGGTGTGARIVTNGAALDLQHTNPGFVKWKIW
jgi:RHS repeat-associated protein